MRWCVTGPTSPSTGDAAARSTPGGNCVPPAFSWGSPWLDTIVTLDGVRVMPYDDDGALGGC